MKQLYVLGLGPGTAEWICDAHKDCIQSTQKLFASQRIKDMICQATDLTTDEHEWVILDGQLKRAADQLVEALQYSDVALLCTGDVGLFSIGHWLIRQVKHRTSEVQIHILPGISSYQYLMAAMQLPWQSIRCHSLHARESVEWIEDLKKGESIVLFTDVEHQPWWIAKQLVEIGLGGSKVTCGYQLSYEHEVILSFVAADLIHYLSDLGLISIDQKVVSQQVNELDFVAAWGQFATIHKGQLCDVKMTDLFLVHIRPEKDPHRSNVANDSEKSCMNVVQAVNEKAIYSYAAGMPDDQFIRGDRPMTKSAIRARVMSLLALRPTDCCWDIGAGTGSCAIEMALMCPMGTVWAIEQTIAGVDLIKQNKAKFKVDHLQVIHGVAPFDLAQMPMPDGVFIGGHEGQLSGIMDELHQRWSSTQSKRMRPVVMTCISLSSLHEMLTQSFEGFELTLVEQIQHTPYLKRGRHWMPNIQNPIWLLKFEHVDDIKTARYQDHR